MAPGSRSPHPAPPSAAARRPPAAARVPPVRPPQHAVIAELGLRALRARDAQEVMDAVVAAVAATLDCELCKVLELLPGGQALLLRAGVGWAPGLVGRGTVSAGVESQAGFTLLEEGPVVTRDLRSEERFTGPPLLSNHGVVSGVSVPIYTSRGPWGVLGVHARGLRVFSAEDVNFVEATASVLGAAIERRQIEEQLRAANARLEDLDRLKTRFLHSVSHELRTPLTPLVLQMEAMTADDGRDPERSRQGLEMVRRNLMRIASIVEDVVDVARLQGGSLEVRLEPLDLAEVVREAVEVHAPAASAGDVALSASAPGPLPVEGDHQRLGQVLDNLIQNALKFTPPGGAVGVEARAEGDLAVVRVRDTGVGLTASQRGALFEPFAQVHPDAGRRGGSGLGLFICKGIVERHGGRIWVASEGPGKGATFAFALRLAHGSRLSERPAPP